MKAGKVYLTGGGCGDIGLLTLKAWEVLRNGDVVVYDSLVSEELLQYTKVNCEKIYVGKRYGSRAMQQSEINELLIKKAREEKSVVRLKGGDPYVFGRGGEEFLAVQAAGIPCEEIPGISSAIAVPAAAGIPVTHRGLASGVTVVTGTRAEEEGQEGRAFLNMDFDTLARLDGTLVILMGMHHLKEITEGLIAAGKSVDTPCAVIMEGTTGRQRCLRTELSMLYVEASGQGFTSPAVIVIGAVAALRLITGGEDDTVQKLAAEGESDAGGQITVGVTGTPRFVEKVAAAFGALSDVQCSRTAKEGGTDCKMSDMRFTVWDMGFMEIHPDKNPLPDLQDYEWLVFTSPNGVRVFLDKMRQERKDLRMLGGKQIAVIGPGTARVLEENGIYADYIPDVYDAAHLAEGLTKKTASTIFLRAKQGSGMLLQIFGKQGLSYCDYPLYELAVCEEKRKAALTKQPDYIVFGSAMGVRAYFEGMEQNRLQNKSSRYVCIGGQCGEELRKHTDREYLLAKEASATAIVECICTDAAGNKSNE